ncbi:hypothetical protein BGZ92_004143 [Podila epicladia]|nr:hypothetical protein BGZ92_004143 [Podila epicladia]
MSASKLCIHNDCIGGTNYCVIRYSYVKIIDSAGDVDSVRYVVPQNVPMTEAFNGKCITAAVGGYNPTK